VSARTTTGKPGRSPRALGVALGVAALLALGFSCAAASASADVTLCTLGSGAAQCSSPEGVDVDETTGRAYVADSRNNRIDVFDSTGSFQFAFGWGVRDGSGALQTCGPGATPPIGTCLPGLAGSGAGELNRPVSVAVDGAAEVLYAVDNNNPRVQKFDLAGNFVSPPFTTNGACTIAAGNPVAVGPTGFFYVAHGTEVGKFTKEGVCLESVTLVEPPFPLHRLAVDPAGNVYATVDGPGGLRKFGPSGTELCSLDPAIETTAVNTDAAGNVFAAEGVSAVNQPFAYSAVAEYGPSCEIRRRFAYRGVDFGFIAPIAGIAPFSSLQGDLYLSRAYPGESGGTEVQYLSFPPLGPVVAAPGVEAPESTVSNTKALLRAEINPEGQETSYHFEYLTQAEFESQGNSFTGPATRSTPPQVLSATPTDFKLHGVQALAGCPDPVSEIAGGTCLTPETVYRFRVVAENASGPGEGTVEGTPFKTRSPLEIVETFATQVGTDTARLKAAVNPLGVPTGGYFEYVDDASYQESGFATAVKAPDVDHGAAPLDFGFAEAPTLRAVTLSPLPADTLFHYRVVATDPLVEPIEGPERTFRTFETPQQPQCPGNEAFRTGASANLGDCRGYEMVSPLDKESGDVVALPEFTTILPATLNQSSTSGSKVSYGTYRAFGNAEAAPFTSQYVAERGEDGWQSHSVTGPRGRLVTGIQNTIDTELKALSPDLCDAWLVTVAEPPLAPGAIPSFPNLYRRHDGDGCGGQGYEALSLDPPAHIVPGDTAKSLQLGLQGLSSDGLTAIYAANDNLVGTAAPNNPGGKEQLYETKEGLTGYVCILPGGAPSTSACSAGTNFLGLGSSSNRGASVKNAISEDGQRVFWTAYEEPSDGPGHIYVRIGGTETIDVSKAGEEASGVSNQSIFLAAAADGSRALYLIGEDLYEFAVGAATTTLLAEEVAGVVGESEDLGRIYFVSEESLAGPNGEGKSPEAGEPNLYLRDGSETTFIATLVAEDINRFPIKGRTSLVSLLPFEQNSRFSADGRQVVFMSSAALTGYDNKDAETGKALNEVFRYDEQGEELRCVSCNPTNARPRGTDVAELTARGQGFFAGGWIKGWANTLYASRALSADGSRVFFESGDALSPYDTNGAPDVYEWELAGSGGCGEASASYSPANGGCVEPISSGGSLRQSEFYDASPSGDDVFFATLEGLVSQDYGLVDVYDARVGGGFPTPPPPPAECEGEACQGAAAAPSARTPSSLTYVGPGNETGEPAKRRCSKGKARRGGRCVKKRKQHGRSGKRAARNGKAGR
jgi:NHL repeat-containing protein